ncbi:MAG: helix-turn-helix domain-containing protein [Acetobacteraceae bacterium]|nr:helix-turn-helix domain-containing protein [Acetobacteraceae bacterium]
MSLISEKFADELCEKEMRDAYLAAQIRTKLTAQIRALRDQRVWSQGALARYLGKPQSNVSRLENREYGNFTLKTLLELASAFDVGLVVEFVPYDEFIRRTEDLRPETLKVRSFSRSDLGKPDDEPGLAIVPQAEARTQGVKARRRHVLTPGACP